MKRFVRKGFTIIEMVIVIAIIGILAAVLIPSYSNVIGRSNKAGAHSSCLSAYKELYSSTMANKGQYMRNGYVFLSGDYAYANMNGTLHELNYMGEFETNIASVNDIFVYLGTVSSSLDNEDMNAVYSLRAGTYSVYTLRQEDGDGVYQFLVYKEGDYAEEKTVQLGPEYEEKVRCVDAAYRLYTGRAPSIEQLEKIADVTLMVVNGAGYDAEGLIVDCSGVTTLRISAEEGKTLSGFSLTTGKNAESVDGGTVPAGEALVLEADRLAEKCSGYYDTLTVTVN